MMASPRFALFAHGFRPLFLLAGLFAALAIPAWLYVYLHGLMPLPGMPSQLWHAHEMFYGFVGAALAGFLLTAVPSWTGARGFAGKPLIALCAAWLGGRLAFACADFIPLWLVAVAEAAFVPILIVLLAPPLLRSQNRNTPLLVVLTALWLTDVAFLYALWNADAAFASRCVRIGIDIMLLIVTLIGGRIVPAFTSNALRRLGETVEVRSWPALERVLMVLMIGVIAIDLWRPDGELAGWLAVAVAIAHAVRISGWRTMRTRSEAILWVLHVGIAWLPIGFALKALWILAGVSLGAYWLHALTMGLFATMILAVMTRAALGHTGRALVVAPSIALAYVLLTLGVIVRVFIPPLVSRYDWTLIGAGALWTAAFALYLIVYLPILALPRADGKPG